MPHRHQIHPDPPRKQGSSQPQGISPAEELEFFCFVGCFFGEVVFFSPQQTPQETLIGSLTFAALTFALSHLAQQKHYGHVKQKSP